MLLGIEFIEWVGYLASICIAISMLMKDIVKLRFMNLVGCLLFTVYGFIIGAYPVAILNLVTTFVNLFYLYKMLGKQK